VPSAALVYDRDLETAVRTAVSRARSSSVLKSTSSSRRVASGRNVDGGARRLTLGELRASAQRACGAPREYSWEKTCIAAISTGIARTGSFHDRDADPLQPARDPCRRPLAELPPDFSTADRLRRPVCPPSPWSLPGFRAIVDDGDGVVGVDRGRLTSLQKPASASSTELSTTSYDHVGCRPLTTVGGRGAVRCTPVRCAGRPTHTVADTNYTHLRP